eukprot:9463696-Alexandrium_andersonii.AAC.1
MQQHEVPIRVGPAALQLAPSRDGNLCLDWRRAGAKASSVRERNLLGESGAGVGAASLEIVLFDSDR